MLLLVLGKSGVKKKIVNQVSYPGTGQPQVIF
jgi:hypothetical protein